jgi:hypothetical protein
MLRVEDKRILDALTVLSKRQRRSRNVAIQIILEEALKHEELWPPADA